MPQARRPRQTGEAAGPGDGDKDLLFSCNGPSQQRLYVNNGAGVFTDESVARLGTLNIAAAGCALAGPITAPTLRTACTMPA